MMVFWRLRSASWKSDPPVSQAIFRFDIGVSDVSAELQLSPEIVGAIASYRP